MDAAIIIALISTVIVCCSVIIAYVQYRDNHRTKSDESLHDVISQIARQANEPLKDQLSDHTLRLTQTGDRLNRIEDLMKGISTDQQRVTETLNKMGVKVDMYWTTLESLAMNAAKGLHQPDPRRARVDHLLEAFTEGTLSAEERLELRKMLVKIRNYEPTGPALDFPVHPGEQTFAAILLSTMDVVDPMRMAALGHAMHRNHDSGEN